MSDIVVKKTLILVDKVFQNTEYEDVEAAEQFFQQLKEEIPRTAIGSDGLKIINKFTALGKTATTEGTFQDMIKIIWRVVKPMSGSPSYRLTLFFLALGAMCLTLESSAISKALPTWMETLETWLAKQVTIGGKGVAGEGEGTVSDRVQRFFSTPYLHDFD